MAQSEIIVRFKVKLPWWWHIDVAIARFKCRIGIPIDLHKIALRIGRASVKLVKS